MAVETERKFLVIGDAWRATARPGVLYRQGYLAKSPCVTIRIRSCAGDQATLTVKGPRRGLTRQEFSYPVPGWQADEMLEGLCGGRVVEKMRYVVEYRGAIWHVDAYRGAAEGLVVAEIELDREDHAFETPPWLGAEVSHNLRYRNSSIALWPPQHGAEPRPYAEECLAH